MQNPIFLYDYLDVLNSHFAVSAALAPCSPCISLGDYGYYVNGTFVKRGNIFELYEMSLDSYLIVESMDDRNALICSSYAQVPCLQKGVSVSGALITQATISLPNKSGFILHLQGIRNELFFPNESIEILIQDMVKKNKWDEQYRMVWQRFVANKTYYAYTQSVGGQMRLFTADGTFFPILQDAVLSLDIPGCRNINLDHWLAPKVSTPAVNFTRIRSAQDDHLGQEDGFRQDELGAMGAKSLILDNGFSVL